MYKKILAPLDGSEFSERSLEHVKAIATGCHVPEVVLFGVVEPVPQPADMGGFVGGEWGYQAEKQALEMKEHLQNVIDSASEVIISIDANKRITTWNKTAEITTGYKQKMC